MNEQEMIQELEELAKEQGLLQEARKEIKLFQATSGLEYLFFVKKLVKGLREKGIACGMAHLSNGSSVLAYLLGINPLNPIKYGLYNGLIFKERFYDDSLPPRFDFSIPLSQRDEALDLLNQMSPINQEQSPGSVLSFVDKCYRIGFFESLLLDNLREAMQFAGEQTDIHDALSEALTSPLDPAVFSYLVADDPKGYYLPNLKGCIYGPYQELYEVLDIVKPQSIEEFAKVICLRDSFFLSRKCMVSQLKTYGIDGMILSREDLLDTLINRYDIEEQRAFEIHFDLHRSHRLNESQELLLRSHEVPERIMEQLTNIRFLSYRSRALQDAALAYALAKRKMVDPERFKKVTHLRWGRYYVGPFFVIGGKLFAYKESLDNHDPYERFINASLSHMEYFDTLGIDADYGNFPRGRVLYDAFQGKFLVYMDRALFRKMALREKIREEYGLCISNTIFLHDSHYQHDGL